MATSTTPARPTRSSLMTVLATIGFAINILAWVLVSVLEPFLRDRHHLGPALAAAVVAAPIAIGSLMQVPVGILTDRYGARLMFSLVSLVSAGAVAVLAVADGPVLVLAASGALGVGATAFTVGASMVIRSGPVRRRGFPLSVFGVGIGGAALGAALLNPLELRTELLTLAALLAGYAVVAAVLIRDTPSRRNGRSAGREAVEALRLSVTRHWAALHAIVFGGVAAMACYLPAYLHDRYRLGWEYAVVDTAVFVGVAAASWPAGGWLSGRLAPTRLLTWCFFAAGSFGIVLAFKLPLPAAVTTFLAIGISLGLASGALLNLIGGTAPRDRAGLIIGLVGAAGGLAALAVPVVLTVLDDFDPSHTIGLMILADIALATALYLRLHRSTIGHVLTFPTSPPRQAMLNDTATTVVAIAAADLPDDDPAVLAALTDLAVRHELVIVYGQHANAAGELSAQALMDAIRNRLPRYRVTAVLMDPAPRVAAADIALVDELVNEGVLAVAIVPTSDPGPTAELVALRLAADLVLRLVYDPVRGAELVDLTQPTSPIPG